MSIRTPNEDIHYEMCSWEGHLQAAEGAVPVCPQVHDHLRQDRGQYHDARDLQSRVLRGHGGPGALQLDPNPLGARHLRLGSRTPATPGAGGSGAGVPDQLQTTSSQGRSVGALPGPAERGPEGACCESGLPALLLRRGDQGSRRWSCAPDGPRPAHGGGPATEQRWQVGGVRGTGVAADLHRGPATPGAGDPRRPGGRSDTPFFW